MSEEKSKYKLNTLNESEQHYFNLAEVYIHYYEDHLDRELKMFLAKGVVVEMHSDLEKWHRKNKMNETSRNQLNRLSILEKAVDCFGALSSTNVHARLSFNKLQKRISELEDENDRLNETIVKLNKFIDETSK